MGSLKPCPFCGCDRPQKKKEPGDPWDDIGYFYYIQCPECRACSGPVYASHGNDCPIHYAEVRDAWNTRAKDAEDPLI